ncbi:hypothetical protein GUJ93_ZPchr0009g178 [Zizania palustris]|uniref:Uncharacterized protein n=1 Tax=Zizania palustris TaxID=103762 RepID=A0A8J5VMD4_ZIZPA|nr:hypothetical protein GUJ93_ZPchr0009g178 [Zizania palustris]
MRPLVSRTPSPVAPARPHDLSPPTPPRRSHPRSPPALRPAPRLPCQPALVPVARRLSYRPFTCRMGLEPSRWEAVRGGEGARAMHELRSLTGATTTQGGRQMYVQDLDLNKEPSPDPDQTPAGAISGLTAPSSSDVLPAVAVDEAANEKDAKGSDDVQMTTGKGNSQPPPPPVSAPEETITSSSTTTQLPDVAVHAPLGTRATAQRIVASIVASRRVESKERDEKHG